MIEDEELRDTFKIASEEHLQKLDQGLLLLEKNPGDQSKLEELLREAHSLKGDAGMLGVKDIATLAHQWEHIIGTIKRGEIGLSPEIIDRLYKGLDSIRQLVKEAVTGEPSGVNTFYALAHMMGADTSSSAQVNTGDQVSPKKPVNRELTESEDQQELSSKLSLSAPSTPTVEDNSQLATLTTKPTQLELVETHKHSSKIVPTQPPVETTSEGTYRIETIRVETRNLDALMTQTGELTVTQLRIARRLTEIEEIVSLWEEWSRDSLVNHIFFSQQNEFDYNNGMLLKFQNLHHRHEERLEQLGNLVNRLRSSVYEDTARLDIIADELEQGIRTLRLLPLSTIFNLFPRMVRDLAKSQGKQVDLLIEGGETRADKRILEEMKDPLMHMIRNAIDHGIETPTERLQLGKPPLAVIRLRGYQSASQVVIELIDDGRGLDLEQIKQTASKRGIVRPEELATMTDRQIYSLIFESGFSTRALVTEVSGRGVGLDVVRNNVERLKGTLQVESILGQGCTFCIHLGTTLSTAHVLIVATNGISYALPVEFVQTTRLVASTEIFAIEGRDTIIWNGQPVSVAKLADLLELNNSQIKAKNQDANINLEIAANPCIILKVGEEKLGLFVDALIDEQDVILKPASHLLKRVRNVSGATILGTGEVCMVLNPSDLLKSVRKQNVSHQVTTSIAEKLPPNLGSRKQVILLVEDSIATRTQEKRILEGAGYEVVTAVDGLDGYNKLKTRAFDAVVSDVQMPNLDGLSLAAKIRQHQEYRELPIILVTSLAADEDKKRGADAGANAYITKGAFNQEVLLETLKRLI